MVVFCCFPVFSRVLSDLGAGKATWAAPMRVPTSMAVANPCRELMGAHGSPRKWP